MQDIAALTAEREQLLARIVEIDALIALAATASGYRIAEVDGLWTIMHDGQPVRGHAYRNHQIAEDMLTGLSSIPDGYSISYGMDGRRDTTLKFIVTKGSRRLGAYNSVRRAIDVAQEDLAAIPGRIARAAERAVEAEAERIAADEATRIAAERANLATPRQIEFILTLLAQQEHQLGSGGFIIGGPTKREDIAKMTKDQASAYITSLKGDY